MNTAVAPPGGGDDLGKGLKSLVVSYRLKRLKRRHVKRLQCAHYQLKGCVPSRHRPGGKLAAKCDGGVGTRKRSYRRVQVSEGFLEESNEGGDATHLEVSVGVVMCGIILPIN